MAIAALQMPALMPATQPAIGAPSGLVCDYQQFGGALRAFLMRQTRCPHDADDLLQEVFLRLLRTDDRRDIRNLRAFMYKTATNLLRDRARRCHTRMLRNVLPDGDIELHDTAGEPSQFVELQQSIERVTHTIAELPPNTRRAFLLYRLDARSHADIAAEMAISVSMVEKHISVATRALRLALVNCGER